MLAKTLNCISLFLVMGCVLGSASYAQEKHSHPKGKPAPEHTKKILKEAGHVAWDMERYQLLGSGKEFDSIHPSLQRQSTLNLGAFFRKSLADMGMLDGFTAPCHSVCMDREPFGP